MRRMTVVGLVLLITTSSFAVAPFVHAASGYAYADLNAVLSCKTIGIGPGVSRAAVVTCPKGNRVLTGGAYLHAAGQGPTQPNAFLSRVTASFPDGAGSWYASAFLAKAATSPLQLTVTVFCSAAALQEAKFHVHHLVRPNHGTGESQVCPGGEQLYTGGWYFTAPRDAAPNLNLANNVVTGAAYADTDRYYAEGFNKGKRPAVLHVVGRCTSQLRVLDQKVVAEDAPSSPSVLGGYLPCVAGEGIISGGVFFHRYATPEDPADADHAHIASSSPTLQGDGWYADGFAAEKSGEDLQMSTIVNCLA